MKKYLCWNCLFHSICKFAEPSLTKCSYQKAMSKHFTRLFRLFKKHKVLILDEE